VNRRRARRAAARAVYIYTYKTMVWPRKSEVAARSTARALERVSRDRVP